MRIITQVQNSDAWLNWRRGGVGASEIPVLMGESDFSTPREIYKEKLGLTQPKESNFAMQRGTEQEPKVRALYELHYDKDMPAMCGEHDELSFFRCSFDGFNVQDRKVLEIKYPGREKFEMCQKGAVPLCYRGQVQSQLFISDAIDADFVCYNGVQIAVANMKPDLEYRSKMIEVVSSFWLDHVMKRVPPPLTDRDYKELNHPIATAMFAEFAMAKINGATEKVLAALKKDIIPFIDHPRVVCSGVKVVRNVKGVHTFTLEAK